MENRVLLEKLEEGNSWSIKEAQWEQCGNGSVLHLDYESCSMNLYI